MSGLIALGIKGSCLMRGGGGGCFETIKRQYIMSIKDEDKVFTSGDVVALKLSPEFRGVIQGLSAKVLNGCNNLPEQIVNCFGSPNDWVRISTLDSDFKTQTIIAPILHLKHVE